MEGRYNFNQSQYRLFPLLHEILRPLSQLQRFPKAMSEGLISPLGHLEYDVCPP